MTDRQIARVCHEANAVYCGMLAEAQPPWENASEWQIESAIAGVKFYRENPDAGPQASHEEWCRHKEAEGWKYGPVKRPELRQHPCLVPFEQLPEEQQRKDLLFRAIVHALAGPVAP